MPASTTTLVVLPRPATPAGPAWNEQASDVSPGNSFLNAPGTMLAVRNTTASAISLIIEADVYGAEQTILTVSVPGSATEGGVAMLGPFPAEVFNEHGTTDSAKTGHVMVRQATGVDGDLQLCPFVAG